MKKYILAFLLALLMILQGCASATGENGGNTTEDEKAARIAALEAELATMRARHDDEMRASAEEIKALKAEIDRLTGKEIEPDGGTMIFHYRVEKGGAVIVDFEGSATLVEIPTTLDGYPVTKIGERAFEGNTSLGAVVIPEGVLEIDWFAFYDCTSLFEVSVPSTVTKIGHAVFDGCKSISIACPSGSYAESYAKSYGIAYTNK